VYRANEQPVAEAQLPLWQEVAPDEAVQLRHSRRARRIAVRIGMTGRVELVVPRGVTERQAREFLHSRAEWIRHHVERRRIAPVAGGEFPPARLELPMLGETWRVFRAAGTGRARLRILPATAAHDAASPAIGGASGVIELRGSGAPADWHRCLLAWLRRRALAEFGARLDALARRHGFSYSAVEVRCQRTRWGSCSTRGVISLNLGLLFQPEDVVHYLLCHELSHTRHMNHSARFWNCVAGCEPRWRELDAALLQGWRQVPAWLLEKP